MLNAKTFQMAETEIFSLQPSACSLFLKSMTYTTLTYNGTEKCLADWGIATMAAGVL